MKPPYTNSKLPPCDPENCAACTRPPEKCHGGPAKLRQSPYPPGLKPRGLTAQKHTSHTGVHNAPSYYKSGKDY